MTYYNQKGQTLTFDGSGFSQYGFNKQGYGIDIENDGVDYENFDPSQVATTVKPATVSTATSGGSTSNLADSIFGVINKAGDVLIAKEQAKGRTMVNSQGQIVPYVAPQTKSGPSTGLIVGLVIAGIAGIVIVAVVMNKKKG
jgi:hypothetical protein